MSFSYPNSLGPNAPGANVQPPTTDSEATAYLLTMFSGEVLATLREKNVFMDLTRTMNVGAGTSHQFPVLGQAQAKRHVRGDSLLGDSPDYLSDIESGQRLISVDRPIVSSFTVDDWDELLTHFEFRAEYATQLGEALARFMDVQIAKTLVKAAKSSATLTSQSSSKAGQVLSASGAATSPTTLIEQIREAAAGFEERDVRAEDLKFFVRPSMYFKIVEQGSDFINRDFGGAGSKARGVIDSVYGFSIGMSNNIPSTNDSSGAAGDINDYTADYRDTVAIGFHRDAVGTVYRENLMVETDRLVEYQQDLVVARMITGSGVLRPECAAVIEDPDLTP